MVIASIELQKAIYSVLSANYNVFDVAPLNTPMPYIVIGAEQILPKDTKTERRTNHIVTIHAWSNKQGNAEIKTMNDFIINSIDESLEVQGFTVDFVTLNLATTVKEVEQDRYINHGVTSLSIQLQKEVE